MIVFNINDLDVQLTKEQVDIFNPQSRKSDYALPVDVPSTPEMDELFSAAFEINGTIRDGIDWNPNHKAVAMLTDDSHIPLLRGYAQLKNIKIKGERISYEVVLYGTIKNLFTEVGEKLLFGNDDPSDDLDFSEYTHDYDLDTAERSWTFDCDLNTNPTDLTGEGKGYLYPLIDVGTSPDLKTYDMQDFRPAFYWYEILFKIFEKAGMRWDSTFLETERFKRYIFPFMGEQMLLTTAQMDALSIAASRTSTEQEVSFYNTPSGNGNPDRSTGEIIIFNNETSDPSAQYNPGTGEFTALENCEVIIEGKVEAYIKYVDGSSQLYPENPDHDHYGNIIVEILKETGGTNYTPVGGGSFSIRTVFDNLPSAGSPAGFDVLSTNDTSDVITTEGYFQSSPIFLQAGEKLYLKAKNYQDDFAGTWWTKALMYVTTNSFVNIRRTNKVVVGQSLDPTICLPNLKQKDFLSMVIKRFNLYLDPKDERIITIEPRDDYYLSDYQDWEQYRSTDNDLVITPMSLLNAKQYDFTHVKDDDLINTQYFNSHSFVYGRKRVFTENEFLQDIKEINDGIAPTPSVNHFDRIIPIITYTDNSGQVTRKASKPRMLYYGGLVSCQSFTIKEYTTSTSFTSYPYTGMSDSPYDPTFWLCWGLPDTIYYDRFPGKDPLKMSTNDLFNEYWYNTIYQIANKDSRVVEGLFWIDPDRYYNASFRDLYWFNNAYHRLLKIEDWVASTDATLTKCTFLKLQKVSTPTIEQQTNGGRSGDSNGNGAGGHEKVPDWIRNSGLGGGVVIGDGDVGGIGRVGLVNADYTNVGLNAVNNSVLGQGVNIPAGQRGVTYINSTLESPLDNVSVINDLIQKTDKITLSSSDLGGINTTPYLLVLNKIEGSSIEINSVFGLLTYDTDVYQDRTLTITNDTGDNLFTFATGFTNQASDQRRSAEKTSYTLRPNENVYIESDGLLTTGLGELTLIINYTILLL